MTTTRPYGREMRFLWWYYGRPCYFLEGSGIVEIDLYDNVEVMG